MKKLISVLLCSILLSCTFTFENANSEEFSKSFNEVFTNTKEVNIFCGNPIEVGYYMGFNYGLLPISIGQTYDFFEEEYQTTIFTATKDFKTIAILLLNDDELCVSSISLNHILYEEKK